MANEHASTGSKPRQQPEVTPRAHPNTMLANQCLPHSSEQAAHSMGLRKECMSASPNQPHQHALPFQ